MLAAEATGVLVEGEQAALLTICAEYHGDVGVRMRNHARLLGAPKALYAAR